MSNRTDVDRVRRPGGVVVPALLWIVLAASGVVNSLGSQVGIDFTARMAAGGVAVLCIVLLIVYHVRRRDR
ncbi:hypothetical protein FHS29_006186 [Saccharothrix tamanrassetensis]|uniref:Uncharacterized protein n=1 Tax=Saccharothrix tamanrassetensis TaxID=1051531 RepID=A0A841CUE5_9PSEU|nr:hypothetical protein [Saccharothrix tamanrassetensis]MBB5959565.1 hypothetical protein [Saccharothrix tamanrassetensis]